MRLGRSTAGNPLERYFRENQGRRITTWIHYLDVYHRHLARFRERPVKVVAFGVADGGALRMWRAYFGRQAKIVGVDLDPRCQALEEPGIRVRIGNKADREFIRGLVAEIGRPDVVIDGGGLETAEQVAMFEELYPSMSGEGVYIAEDVHTSYWPAQGGGLRQPGTFVEYAKGVVDQLNAWHARDEELAIDELTLSTKSVHFYGSVVVFERGRMVQPQQRTTGTGTLDGEPG